MLTHDQHHTALMGLLGNLDRDPNFKRVSLADARLSDAVSMKAPGGQHAVLFTGGIMSIHQHRG